MEGKQSTYPHLRTAIRHGLLLAVVAGWSGPARGEAELLELEEAIQTALENNLTYRAALIDPEIARYAVTVEEAAFDTELFASGRVSQTEQPTPVSETTATSSDNRNWQAGLRKQLTYGTTISAQTNLDRSDNNARTNLNEFGNLSQTADLALSVRQPLLGGFGRKANLAGVESARAGLTASRESLRDKLLEILSRTELAYWSIARWQEQLKLNQSNLEVADTLLKEARERERVGLATGIEVLQAEASKARRMEEIIETKRQLGDALDELLTLMGVLPGFDGAGTEPAFAVAPLPGTEELDLDFGTAWEQALANDPMLATQDAVIAQREWDRVAARNSLKPDLDLVFTGAYSGIDNRYADEAFDKAFEGDGHAWSVGFELSMPWNRRADRSRLLTADKRFDQETLRYAELKQSLFRDLRATWRNLEAVSQSLEAARLTVSLQEATFEREKSKYEEGLSSFRDVLQSQSELDQARVRLLLSKFNKLAAEIDMARLTGTLLKRHNLNELSW